MKHATITKHLTRLRAECIDGTDDLLLKRVAYEIECAVRRVSEPTVRWPNLADMAKSAAQSIRAEFDIS